MVKSRAIRAGLLLWLFAASAISPAQEVRNVEIKTDSATGYYLIRLENWELLAGAEPDRRRKVANPPFGPHQIDEPAALLVGATYYVFIRCGADIKPQGGYPVSANRPNFTIRCGQ